MPAENTLAPRNPFVGPVTLERGQPIFGRDTEIEQIFYQICADRVMLLYSPSGAGKSSLLRAGLVDRCAGSFDVRGPVRVNADPGDSRENRFIRSLKLSLEAAIPAKFRRSEQELAGQSLAEYFARCPRRVGAPSGTLLLIDQFEELLTVDPLGYDAKRECIRQLGEFLGDPHAFALIALREDYLAQLDPYCELVPTHLSSRYRLDLLTREKTAEAMIRTAAHGEPKRDFDSAAASALSSDLATVMVQQPDGSFVAQTGRYVEPLHLQIVCRRLWNIVPDGQRGIGAGDIAALGDVTLALGDFYDAEVTRIAAGSTHTERDIREWFEKRLITRDGVRRPVLRGVGASEGLDNALIQKLIAAHLVRGEERSGATWFELAHDRLIAGVRQRNAAWFETTLSRLQKAAADWEAQDRPDRMLLLGDDLAEAQSWAAANPGEVLPLEQMFLDRSAEEQKRLNEKEEYERNLIFMLEKSDAQRLATVAVLQRDRRYDLAALLALEAVRRMYMYETLNAILSVEQANPRLWTTLRTPAWNTDVLLDFILKTARYSGACLAVSPQGLTAATSTSPVVWLWDPDDLSVSKPLHEDGADDFTVDFSPDGDRIARGTYGDGRIHIMKVADSTVLLAFDTGHRGAVSCLRFSPAGGLIASGGWDNTVRVFDATDGHLLLFFESAASVNSIAFHPGGRILAAGCDDGRLRLWSLPEGKLLELAAGENGSAVRAVAFSPDGKYVAAGSWDRNVYVYDVEKLYDVEKGFGDPGPPKILEGHTNRVNGLAFSPDGTLLASGGVDQNIQIWRTDNWELAETLPLAHFGGVAALVFHPDGSLISTGLDRTVRVWLLFRRSPGLVWAHRMEEPAICVAFSPDGNTVACGSYSGLMAILDVENQREVTRLQGHDGLVQWVAFGPAGDLLASAGEDATVRLWQKSAEGGEWLPAPVACLEHGAALSSVVFEPAGQSLITATADGTVARWDLQAERGAPAASPSLLFQEVLFQKDLGITCLAISPDGVLLAAGDWNGDISLWNLQENREAGILTGVHFEAVRAVAFDRAGGLLASGSSDQSVVLWDAASRKVIGEPLRGHEARVLSVAFGDDKLASSDQQGTVRLWDLSGQPLGDPRTNPDSSVSALSFSPDGNLLATAGSGINIWNLHSGMVQRRIWRKVHRNLSRLEWELYMEKRPYRKTFDDLPFGDGVVEAINAGELAWEGPREEQPAEAES